MIGNYFDIFTYWEILHQIEYAPDGKRGFFARSTQKKRRKKRRRVGKGGE